ncbi:ubiquinone anaerobic biosynthesis accessory factor UbiT [Pararhodobacter sp.]|uniref:ubiquinone anaerobic biosynthesis accessory factor UbiT n=1 Tax=Pararhodobacter sp. TaxID=2127056 RepID=UPI002AFF0429|nr:SCP2 sterol-binding domain-containing protein [Pararhodobacter sp.]
MSTPVLPPMPRPLALAVRSLPLAPISTLLTSLTRQLMQRHPGLQRRLGDYASRRFLLDLTDLPFLLLLEPGTSRPRVTAHARRSPPRHDTRIAGLTAAFLGMLHGSLDGDALFFSRDLVIEGDTAAGLALRNAIDNAELDLTVEMAVLLKPLAPLITRLLAIGRTP